MAINDSDKLLINDGSKTETITFAQFKDGNVLNDSDKFLINNGTKTETITWAEIEDEIGPNGIVNTPVVLKPDDGAGSGETRYLKSGVITQVGGGGTALCETSLIQNVDTATAAPNVILTFPDSQGFNCFPVGAIAQLNYSGTPNWHPDAPSACRYADGAKWFDGDPRTSAAVLRWSNSHI